MKKSAETAIIDFLRANPSKYAAAELQRMSFHNKNGTLASPKAISRRLQENAEAGGMLEVSYDDHGNAFYQIRDEHKKKTRHEEMIEKEEIDALGRKYKVRVFRVTYA